MAVNPYFHMPQTMPSFYKPSKLTHLASRAVIRLLVYEDYEDCNFYRWDPVIIWQFETHQPKKRKASKKGFFDNTDYGHPPPPWKGVQSLRNWWCDRSGHLFGHPVESPLRQLIIDALEKQSWTSCSEEEDILFLLLRLCMDFQLHFESNFINENWFSDLAQIIDNLGPCPLQKLVIGSDVFQGNTLILSTIIQNSPYLQVLRIGQWELSNEILFSLATHCPLLQEFSVHGMEADMFISDDPFFKCFFNGMSPEEVLECHCQQSSPQISFNLLKYVDILFCKQTERLVLMLAYFYPNVSLSAFDISSNLKLFEPFLEADTKMPFLRMSGRTEDLIKERFYSCAKYSSFLKEIRLHIDDKFPGADIDTIFKQELEVASQKLKKFLIDYPTIDSVALRPHAGVDISKVVLPAFSCHGNLLKCVYFTFDFSSVCLNTVYQLLNLCPLLEKLIIDVSLSAKDTSYTSFKTQLRDHPTLETLVVQELSSDMEDRNDEDCDQVPVHMVIAKDVLRHSPNLKNLSLCIWENCELRTTESLFSTSVERVQLSTDKYCTNWVSFLLPSFPNLKLLSLQGGSREPWSEVLESLSKKEINITKKRLEFANTVRWHEKSVNSSQSAFIMVM